MQSGRKKVKMSKVLNRKNDQPQILNPEKRPSARKAEGKHSWVKGDERVCRSETLVRSHF
jgi:hypothetical protein